MSFINFRCVLVHNLKLVVRKYTVKRKFPQSVEEIDNLPVFEYVGRNKNRKRLYVWGRVETGALGIKHYKKQQMVEYHVYPKRTSFSERHEVVSAACGFGFSAFAIKSSDHIKVYGTGVNTDSQIGYHELRRNGPLGLIYIPQPIFLPFKNPKETKVNKVSAGRAHLVILSDEGLFLLGNNSYGQCGRRIVPDEKYSGSKYVHHIAKIDGKSVTDVVCGQDHTIAITEDGQVYSCGWGADGQTGLGHFDSISKFTRVKGDIEKEKITKISCRSDFVMALNEKGQVFGWGNTEYSQIVTQERLQQVSTPMHIKMCESLGVIKDIASSGSSCLVLNEQGFVYVWGFGILGTGPKVQQSNVPIQIPPSLFGVNHFNLNNRVTSITCGLSHMAAITSNGELYMWGRNRSGCLGLGSKNDQYFPLKVALGAEVEEIICGLDHNVAICRSFIHS